MKKLNKKSLLLISLIYFLVYFSYLCIWQENEYFHWISLVFIPILILGLLGPVRLVERKALFALLSDFGLQKNNSTNKLTLSIILGLAFCGIQLFFGRNKSELLPRVMSVEGLYLLPLSFLLCVFTAGFTEEFFFRGFLLKQLFVNTRFKFAAIVFSAALFSIYHLPYAFFNPRWPSHGNLNESVITSFSEAMPIGLVLGYLYLKSGNNLMACIVLHSLINTIPVFKLLIIH